MNIGIDALSIFHGKIGGGETYVTQLVKGLASIDKENQYTVFAARHSQALFQIPQANFTVVSFPSTSRLRGHKALRFFWEQAVLPWQSTLRGIDVMHYPANTVPLCSHGATVLTLHDTVASFYKSTFHGYVSTLKLFSLTHLVTLSARKAHQVITDSAYIKDRLVEGLKLPPSKISVVNLGVATDGSGEWHAAPHKIQVDGWAIDPPYILWFGNKQKHKNLERLVDAFTMLRRVHNLPHKLVLAGMKENGYSDLLKKIEELDASASVLLPDHVSDGELEMLIRGADLFVFPSLYEGFGLPVLEVMGLGLPVVCSKAASLPEVAGDAAVYCDPLDANSMASAMLNVLSTPSLRTMLVKRGRDRVKQFSWEDTARKTLAVYEKSHRSSRAAAR